MNYYYQQPQTQMQSPSVRLVDGIDVVKSAEVPFNSYGLFMKADLTEMWLKAWNPDATTRIITYRPEIKPVDNDEEDGNAIILKAIQNLDKKLESMKNTSPTPMKKKKMEVEDE